MLHDCRFCQQKLLPDIKEGLDNLISPERQFDWHKNLKFLTQLTRIFLGRESDKISEHSLLIFNVNIFWRKRKLKFRTCQKKNVRKDNSMKTITKSAGAQPAQPTSEIFWSEVSRNYQEYEQNFKMKAKLINLGSKSKRMVKDRILNIDSDVDKEYVLGRNRDAQCMILDVNVSRRHASFKFDSSRGWTVTDNKVRNSKIQIYIGQKIICIL